MSRRININERDADRTLCCNVLLIQLQSVHQEAGRQEGRLGCLLNALQPTTLDGSHRYDPLHRSVPQYVLQNRPPGRQ